ncbi:VOC family protein [Natronomonas halophila]|uniref:VOC family protein n=1 Tax=Natronomonas halophila TaxID=2747817 RepID=UPI0015B6B397|nr:VOC family protein [Natronomonas halophila]QLD84962.1 VOC family protein [Natronomonas halophila]
MDGIVFFRTERLEEVVEFYTEAVGAEVWLEQSDCTILAAGDFRFGFCDREEAETDGILTFVVDSRERVDLLYDQLHTVADDEPRYNETYEIYQFFAADPEGRTVEVQVFEHETGD